MAFYSLIYKTEPRDSSETNRRALHCTTVKRGASSTVGPGNPGCPTLGRTLLSEIVFFHLFQPKAQITKVKMHMWNPVIFSWIGDERDETMPLLLFYGLGNTVTCILNFICALNFCFIYFETGSHSRRPTWGSCQNIKTSHVECIPEIPIYKTKAMRFSWPTLGFLRLLSRRLQSSEHTVIPFLAYGDGSAGSNSSTQTMYGVACACIPSSDVWEVDSCLWGLRAIQSHLTGEPTP